MNIAKRALQFAAVVIAGSMIISQFSFNIQKKDIPDKDPVSQWHIPQTPDTISFAGEKVPLERWDVNERFDRQLLFIYYQTSNIIYIKKLANRYFPVIEERLRANGVPDDFKYLCVAESNLEHAISRSGAVGFWQFMSYTAPGYNLEITKEVDERYHVIKSTDAACRYLKAAYKKFGTWTAAAASYNCGQGGYQKRSALQGVSNYYDLQLPEETNRYMFRILSFKYLLENAEMLGFILSNDDLYQHIPTRTYKIEKSISNLAKFAVEQGTTYKMLKDLNPWLRSTSIQVKPGKSYLIRLPADN